MTNIGYQVLSLDKRIEQQKLDELKAFSVTQLDDCMNRMAALDSSIHGFNKQRVFGPAFTVNVPAGDNLLFYAAIKLAKEGDVIVVNGQGYQNRALCGEIMATLAKKKKLGGFIVDGAIRDAKEISEMDFGVYAKCVSANGPYKNGPGEINKPITVGGRVICPGDVICADGDGVISIPFDEVDEVICKAKKVQLKESQMLEEIEKTNDLNVDWVFDQLKKDNCEFVGGKQNDC